MERERRSTGGRVEARAAGDGGASKIGGYASVFHDGTEATEYVLWEYPGERAVERIMAGAFTRALREDDVRGLWNHEPDHLLGRSSSGTLRLSQDGKGLAYEITLPDTQVGRDVAELVRRGDVTGSSFSFVPEAVTWRMQKRDDGLYLYVREITSAKLYDVGPVTFPAYAGASVGARAGEKVEEARRSFEAWKREQGPPLAARLAAIRARAVEVLD